MTEKHPDWNEIKKHYIAGTQPRDLCKEYGLNYKTLTNKITYEGWKKQRKEISEKIGEKVGNLEAEAIQRMREQEREHSDMMIEAILGTLIKDGEVNPGLNPQEINALVNSYEKIQRIKYKSFGIGEKFDLDGLIGKDMNVNIIVKNAGGGEK